MRSVIRNLTLCVAVLAPAVAWAEPVVTGVELESTESEARLVVTVDPPDPTPATRLMRGDRSLRLRFADASAAEGINERIEDETLRRFRLLTYRGRVILRADPRSASAVDLLERAEVQPHPRGLALVIQRSDNEVASYRDNHAPPRPAQETERASADEESDEASTEEASAPSSASTRAASEDGGASAERRRASSSQRSERPARAQRPSESGPPSGSEEDSGYGAVRTAAAVGFVVLLGGLAWYMRRRRGGAGASGPVRSIDVVAAKRIGPRQSLILVDVCGQTLLVGATEKGMTRLAAISARGSDEEEPEEDLQFGDDEEIAPLPQREPTKRTLTPLERELRKSLGEPEEERPSFRQTLRGAVDSPPKPSSDLAGLLAAQAAAIRGKPSIGSSLPIGPSTDSPDAVEGLLRLRQMVDGGATPPPRPANGKLNGSSNGSELSLAALESLLTSRQAN